MTTSKPGKWALSTESSPACHLWRCVLTLQANSAASKSSQKERKGRRRKDLAVLLYYLWWGISGLPIQELRQWWYSYRETGFAAKTFSQEKKKNSNIRCLTDKNLTSEVVNINTKDSDILQKFRWGISKKKKSMCHCDFQVESHCFVALSSSTPGTVMATA